MLPAAIAGRTAPAISILPGTLAELKEWDKRTWRNFRADYSVEELEARFLFERERLAEGKPIKGKDFYRELHQRLEVTSHACNE